MRRPLLLLAVLGALAAPASAAAPTPSVALKPNTPKAHSTALLHVSGDAAGFRNRVPSSLVLAVQRGFVLDPHAVAARCAKPSACPESSRVGRGTADVTVVGPGLLGAPTRRQLTADIGVFLARPARRGDLAGVVISVKERSSGMGGSATGRIVHLRRGAYGYEIRFDSFPSVALPPGYSLELDRLDASVGAHRRVRGKTVSFITNPPRCRGAFRAEVRASFSDGSRVTRALTAPCRRR